MPVLNWRTCPSLVQVISGAGYDWTSQSNDTMWPSITLTSSSLRPIILGGTERDKTVVLYTYRAENNVHYKIPAGNVIYRVNAKAELWTFRTLHCQTEELLNCSNLVLG